MRRLFLNAPLAETVTIRGQDAHHLGYSLRARAGQHCTVADVNGEVAEMEIVSFTADTVTLKLEKRLPADTESPLKLVLAMCLPKADKMDFIVQKATELGASAIQPLRSANCVVKYDAKKSEARREKWQRVAAEAGKQCARTVIPVVEPVREIGEWLEEIKGDTELCKLMCYESEEQLTIGSFLAGKSSSRYLVLIGPEGGFSLQEALAAEQAGFACVTLGRRILKAETAAVAALTVVQYEKGDLGGRVKA